MARGGGYADDSSRPKRSIAKPIIGIVVTLLLLAGAVVVIDMASRDFTEARAADEIADRLPDGSRDIAVEINGFSFLQQTLSGSFDDVDISFTMNDEALTSLARNADYAGTLGVVDGELAAESAIEVLGVSIPYSVKFDPSVEGDYLVLTATAISALAQPDLDLTQYVELGTVGLQVCTAALLPESVSFERVSPRGDVLEVVAVGRNVPVDLDALLTRGACEEPEESEGSDEQAEPEA